MKTIYTCKQLKIRRSVVGVIRHYLLERLLKNLTIEVWIKKEVEENIDSGLIPNIFIDGKNVAKLNKWQHIALVWGK